MLIVATFVSLALANSAMSGSFIGFWEHFHIGPASLGLHLNAHEWVNEGLMALFFFNVGLEIKREFAFGGAEYKLNPLDNTSQASLRAPGCNP
jgi:NhaA family Na+:H+ antiporter